MKKKPSLKKLDGMETTINGIAIETLRVWKNASTKAKLDWLESALRFGKLKKW